MNTMGREVDPAAEVRMSQHANSQALQLTPKAKRRLSITMNVVMGFMMFGLVLVAGFFGLLLLMAHGVVA